MNTNHILSMLKGDGFDARSRWAEDNSGVEIGVRVKGTSDLYIIGLAPIDDESDSRFVEFLESKARKTVEELSKDWDLI